MLPICPLSELTEIRTGYQFRGTAPYSADGKHSIIQLKDSKDFLLLEDQEVQKYDLDNIKESDLVNSNDILLRAKGNNHYAVLVDKQLNNSLVSSLCLVIRCNETLLSPAFLTWYLNQPPAQAFLNKISAGTSIPIVSKKTLLDLEIPLPPPQKQKSIGNLYQLLLKEEKLSKELSNAKQQTIKAKMLCLIENDQSLNSIG